MTGRRRTEFCSANASSSVCQSSSSTESARKFRCAPRPCPRVARMMLGSTKFPGPRQHFAAAQHFSALRPWPRRWPRNSAPPRPHRSRVPSSVSVLERIADAHLGVGGEQAPFEFGRARAMHQHSPRGGAALTGGSDGAENNRGHRQVQIGVFIDDQCVVAAQLQQALAEALRRRARRSAVRPAWIP